jgi:beta-glucanase (GH16 family)
MRRRDFILTALATALAPVESREAQILSPPPRAAAAGFNQLVFNDEFDQPPDIGFAVAGHKWNAGLWWEQVPAPTAFTQSGSQLVINAGSANDVNLCTQYHDASGGTQFLGGYFEARMSCFDWSAFWLFCWDRPTVYGNKVLASDPLTWTNEIDIVETDPGYPDSVWCTLHENSSGDTVPDAQNYPAEVQLNEEVVGYWHNYGLLWLKDELTWFVDEIPVRTLPAYPSTWQPVQLILTAAPGGVNGSPSRTTPPTTHIDWVRVWH